MYAAGAPSIQSIRPVMYHLPSGNLYRVLFEWNYTEPVTPFNEPEILRLKIASDPGQAGTQRGDTNLEATFNVDRKEPYSLYLEIVNCDRHHQGRAVTNSHTISVPSKVI